MSSIAIESSVDALSKLGINADFASFASNLHKNLQLLSSGQIELAKMLLKMGQSHLFEHWADPGVDNEEKKGFFDQMDQLNSSYHGGLASYVKSARQLLAYSQAGKNPFDGFTPSAYVLRHYFYFLFLSINPIQDGTIGSPGVVGQQQQQLLGDANAPLFHGLSPNLLNSIQLPTEAYWATGHPPY